jgi:hypothetical protein
MLPASAPFWAAAQSNGQVGTRDDEDTTPEEDMPPDEDGRELLPPLLTRLLLPPLLTRLELPPLFPLEPATLVAVPEEDPLLDVLSLHSPVSVSHVSPPPQSASVLHLVLMHALHPWATTNAKTVAASAERMNPPGKADDRKRWRHTVAPIG